MSLASSRIHKVEHVLTCAIIVSISLKDGDVVRQWTWPAPHYKLPVSVVVALNENLSFRCNSLTNASLYFSCGALSHKLSVAPLLENLGQGCDVEEVSKTPLVVVQSVHTLELLCSYAHWSSCVHTHIGALVFIYIGALVFIHTLELLCPYIHWSSCVHTHTNSALWCVHTYLVELSYLTTRQQGYLLKTKGPFSSSTAHNMLPPEIPVKKGTRRKVSNHNQ